MKTAIFSRSWIMSKLINICSNFFHYRVATPFQCIEAIQTRSIARPLCDSRASCLDLSWCWRDIDVHAYTVLTNTNDREAMIPKQTIGTFFVSSSPCDVCSISTEYLRCRASSYSRRQTTFLIPEIYTHFLRQMSFHLSADDLMRLLHHQIVNIRRDFRWKLWIDNTRLSHSIIVSRIL